MASFVPADQNGRARVSGFVVREAFGIATLVGGSKVVALASVTSTCALFLTRQTLRGTPNELSVVLNPGVGFTINTGTVALPGTETSDIAWLLVDSV